MNRPAAPARGSGTTPDHGSSDSAQDRAPEQDHDALRQQREDRASRMEERFTWPVVIAAVASVPAMFLTTLEGAPEQIGSAINLVTLAVFVAETLVLLALTPDRWNWVRRHRFVVGITLLTIPAVVFAVGPVQILRLLRAVRVIGALRILRVRRIFKAGRILRERAGLTGWAWRATFLVLSLAAAGFVAFILADPTSTSRQAIDATVGRFGFLVVPLAGAILAGATYVVARSVRSDDSDDSDDSDEPDGSEGGDVEDGDRTASSGRPPPHER